MSDVFLSTLQSKLTHPKRRLGHYTLKELIGEGTFGRVWKAKDNQGRHVAIKIPETENQSNALAVLLTLREGEILGNLEHPNIVKMIHLEVPELDRTMPPNELEAAIKAAIEKRQVYIVMEYVSGRRTLLHLIKGEHPGLGRIVKVMLEVCRAVKFAHDQEEAVYHRDLKPENILIDEKGRPKVADFGIAVAANEQQLWSRAGSCAYMSPERLRGEQAFGDGDVWALGVILYMWLSGELPFSGESDAEISEKIKDPEHPHKPLKEYGVPSDLANVCEDCLRKKTRERCSLAEMIKALEALEDLLEPATQLDNTGQPPVADLLSSWHTTEKDDVPLGEFLSLQARLLDEHDRG